VVEIETSHLCDNYLDKQRPRPLNSRLAIGVALLPAHQRGVAEPHLIGNAPITWSEISWDLDPLSEYFARTGVS